MQGIGTKAHLCLIGIFVVEVLTGLVGFSDCGTRGMSLVTACV
jgi:hypothetical protein